ncbi:hypothetical protein D3C75_590350 [compost metagenome]
MMDLGKKKERIIFFIVIISIFSIAIIILGTYLFQSESKRVFNSIFNPSRSDISRFIHEGVNSEYSDLKRLGREHQLILKNNHLKIAASRPPVLYFESPEYLIQKKAKSYYETSYEGLKVDEAARILRDASSTWHFSFITYEAPGDPTTNFKIVMRQGDSSSESHVRYYGDSAEYSTAKIQGVEYVSAARGLLIESSSNQFDLSKPIEVVIYYDNNDDYAVYELDLKSFAK